MDKVIHRGAPLLKSGYCKEREKLLLLTTDPEPGGNIHVRPKIESRVIMQIFVLFCRVKN